MLGRNWPLRGQRGTVTKGRCGHRKAMPVLGSQLVCMQDTSCWLLAIVAFTFSRSLNTRIQYVFPTFSLSLGPGEVPLMSTTGLGGRHDCVMVFLLIRSCTSGTNFFPWYPVVAVLDWINASKKVMAVNSQYCLEVNISWTFANVEKRAREGTSKTVGINDLRPF